MLLGSNQKVLCGFAMRNVKIWDKIKKIRRNIEPDSQLGQIWLRFPCGTRNDSIIACKPHPESPSRNGIPCCLASI